MQKQRRDLKLVTHFLFRIGRPFFKSSFVIWKCHFLSKIAGFGFTKRFQRAPNNFHQRDFERVCFSHFCTLSFFFHFLWGKCISECPIFLLFFWHTNKCQILSPKKKIHSARGKNGASTTKTKRWTCAKIFDETNKTDWCISSKKWQFHMAKLIWKRGLGRSIIRCLLATHSPTVNVGPKVTPTRRHYRNSDSHRFQWFCELSGFLETF